MILQALVHVAQRPLDISKRIKQSASSLRLLVLLVETFVALFESSGEMLLSFSMLPLQPFDKAELKQWRVVVVGPEVRALLPQFLQPKMSANCTKLSYAALRTFET